MAYPAPTISVINAFNVDSGTTINFNIVGGTDIVRSNKLYIYDTADNSLVLTHLYVSTESIHELPQKTDSSIVYAVGKSSADFVNEHQYYACIQTFTNTTATEGVSGFSVAKLFWALPTPTLTFSTVPASIATTSYNFEAVYNTQIASSIDVTNELAQYQFDLYKSTGALVQTSTVIVGAGTQVGTSTTYNLSYNFTGLEDGSSYYAKCTAVTSQGMDLVATSGTFAVNVSAPSLGAATVVNNACDGYISVTSNLSASYTNSITKVLVKRKDGSDSLGRWLTLFSIDITQASDMNFTVIDFYNRHGREYQYALVPVMVQEQSGVEVEIEGSYTASGWVESKFDGVFICDNTAIQKFKAGAEYNDMSRKQAVGSIETIGNKYPIIVSNNNLNYMQGSFGAYAIHDGFYSSTDYPTMRELIDANGQNLITSDNQMFVALTYERGSVNERDKLVAQREAIEKFLTNKSPKILKDWNGNIWLVAFTSEINLTFANEWGMGLAKFDASWVEIGDPEDQISLQETGLIDIGGV